MEVTLSWPGVALRLQQAISQRDYPVVQGVVVVALVVAVTVVVDAEFPLRAGLGPGEVPWADPAGTAAGRQQFRARKNGLQVLQVQGDGCN